ncbi:GSCOCG00007404001-RA-CDS [Cotesia congregata]|nr:GSCOCG00007404001-RA-CDS [Cotesia congregata]
MLKFFTPMLIKTEMAAETSDMLPDTKIPKVRATEINKTVVKELLNQPDTNVDMIVFDQDRPIRNHTTLLCIAVRNGDEELIDYLINRKADVNKSPPRGYESPVHIAAMNGDTEVFKKLYHLGANTHLKSSLISAVRSGHNEIVKFLIEQGFDANVTEPECGSCLLHYAVEKSNTELVEFLLENNAEIDAKKHNGVTPLYYAIVKERINIVKLLMARGADINNCISVDRKSTLMEDVHNKTWILKYLLSLDEPMTDINIRNKAGQTILHYKFSNYDDDDKTYSIILDAGVDVNAQDSEGQLAIDGETSLRTIIQKTILKRHIVKFISAGLPVCERNRRSVERGFDYLSETCLKELEKIKINKVGVSNITFFDVLHMSFHNLAIRLNFAGLDKVIDEEKLNTAYPLYGGMIFYKLSKVRRRITYLKEIEKFVEVILWDLELPWTFIRDLWSYFTNIELKKLILHENKNFIRFL